MLKITKGVVILKANKEISDVGGGKLMKKNILYSSPFIIAFLCIVAFNLIGSKVMPDGTLVEPFFLIPIAYIFFFIGIIGLVGRGIFSIVSSFKNKKVI